jgi:ABC-type transporter Mla MlaB component
MLDALRVPLLPPRDPVSSWPGLEIRREQREGATLLCVAGELDISGAARLDEEIAAAAAACGSLVLDLSGVTFCDSSGLAVLLRARRRHAGIAMRPGAGVLHVARLGCVDEALFGPAADVKLRADDAAGS